MIKKKSKIVKICVIIFIVAIVILCKKVYDEIDKRNSTIEMYHNTMITYAKDHLANTDLLLENYSYEDSCYDLFIEVAKELRNASEYIEHFSIYYTYKEKGSYGCNSDVRIFFGAYSRTANKWARAFMNQEENEIPSYEDVENYIKDIERIVERFETYSLKEYNHDVKIEDLTFDELRQIIIDLANEIECDDVRGYITTPLKERLNYYDIN